VYRHEVSFEGGIDVAEGKEAMLKPTTVHDGRTTRLTHITHRAEIQSLALYDPLGSAGVLYGQTVGGGGGGGGADADVLDAPPADDRIRLASVDAAGRGLITTLARDWTSDADMAASDSSPQYTLEPFEPGGVVSSMPGWAGVCFNHSAPNTVAVARHFAKTLDVFDGDRRVRTMHTLLNPYAVTFVPANSKSSGSKSGGGSKSGEGGGPGEGLLAVAEGNQLSLWDVRQSERGGCVRRMTLSNRGQPLYTIAAGTSHGAEGGGGVQISKMRGGEPIIAAAGAERGVHVLDADRWSVVKRWPTAIKP
jgi:hypothetical protein